MAAAKSLISRVESHEVSTLVNNGTSPEFHIDMLLTFRLDFHTGILDWIIRLLVGRQHVNMLSLLKITLKPIKISTLV